MDRLEKCYEEAKKVIKVSSTKNGLFASGGIKGYNAVWSRDSMISMIGASSAKEESGPFKEVFKQSLITLEKNQSAKGQIPNAVDKFSKRAPHVDFGSIDSSLWFVIGEYIYNKRYGGALIKKHKKAIEKAVTWLSYQDPGENSMLEQLPTTDWQDAFPHKYGDTINTQALYYFVLNLIKDRKTAKKLKINVNESKGVKLWGGKFYIPWRWKNHNKYLEKGEWFDTLGNLLAIVFDLADPVHAEKILKYIKNKKIAKPYPIKAIYPPIKPGSKEWQDYFKDCDARTPNHYLNGGIWTYIGAFYILALIKYKKFKEAEIHLKKLAEANLNGNFPEWIDPIDKKSHGDLQSWNAGMYILAYNSFKKKKILL